MRVNVKTTTTTFTNHHHQHHQPTPTPTKQHHHHQHHRPEKAFEAHLFHTPVVHKQRTLTLPNVGVSTLLHATVLWSSLRRTMTGSDPRDTPIATIFFRPNRSPGERRLSTPGTGDRTGDRTVISIRRKIIRGFGVTWTRFCRRREQWAGDTTVISTLLKILRGFEVTWRRFTNVEGRGQGLQLHGVLRESSAEVL